MTADPLGESAARFEVTWVTVDDGVRLRVLHWEPRAPRLDWPVVFVPGWISLVDGWADLLRGLVERQPVWYVETREKGSAVLPPGLGAASFTIERNAADLVQVGAAIGADPARRVIVASSLGATVTLEALGHALGAAAAFLIGPTTDFPRVWWVGPLTRLPSWLYPPVRSFLLWYLRRFKVDARREPAQMARYERTMASAEPTRLKYSARVFMGFSVWAGLDAVRVPVGVAWAESDTLHGSAAVRRLVEQLPRGIPVPCPTNLHMHRADVITDLDRFLAEVVTSGSDLPALPPTRAPEPR